MIKINKLRLRNLDNSYLRIELFIYWPLITGQNNFLIIILYGNDYVYVYDFWYNFVPLPQKNGFHIDMLNQVLHFICAKKKTLPIKS